MIAFHVYLNGEKVATAGVGDLGVLSTHVIWVRRQGQHTRAKTPDAVEEELTLGVGGLISPTGEDVRWQDARPVQVGDEVRIKIVELASVDEPSIRKKSDPVKDEQRRKSYVKEMAKQLGWKLVIPKDKA